MKKTLLFSALPILILNLLLQTFSFSQNLQWAKSFGGTSTDGGYAIATDALGNVYSTGNFTGTVDFDPGAGVANSTTVGTGCDIFISKLNSSGNFLWAKSMGGTGSACFYSRSIITESSGIVYTTGFFDGTADFDPGAGTFNLTASGNNDIFISKLDASGNFLWAKSMGGTGIDQGYSMVIDAANNVYTTGYFEGTVDFDPGAGIFNLTSSASGGIFISKLDSIGNFIWAKEISGTNTARGYSIALDTSANIYTTGWFAGIADFDPGVGTFNLTSTGGGDIFICKLDSAGNFVWAKAISVTSAGIGYSLTLDTTGSIYTTGYFAGTADFDPSAGTFNLTSVGINDIFISKLDASGNFVWAKAMGGTGNDAAGSVVTDATGNVYSTGYFAGVADFDPSAGIFNLTSVGINDIFISKLDASGNFLWAKGMGGISSNFGSSLVLDASSNIYTVGAFSGTADFDPGICSDNLTSAGGGDVFVAKYDQNNPPVSICVTTVDSFSTKNIIAWDKPITTGITSFKIYRDSGTGYIPVVTLPYSLLSEYFDNVNPNIHSYHYKISIIDTNGIESDQSNSHETMFMQKTQASPPAFNLTWNDYCGFPVTKYYILCDSNNTNFWKRIDSVNFGTNVYVDPTPATDSANYRIEVEILQPCTVTTKNPTPQATAIKSTKSNASERIFGTGIHEIEKDLQMNIYPNPSSGKFQLSLPNFQSGNKYECRIYDMVGKIISQQEVTNNPFSLSLSLPAGIYQLQVTGKAGVANRKLVIQ